MKTLFLIDGNALIHRAYHAIQPMFASSGLQTNAVYGFTSMMLNILEMEHPDYIAIAFDHKGKTFRHESMDTYKATRKKMEDPLREQIEYVHRIADSFNIPKFVIPGYEADDTLVTIAKRVANPDLKVVIVTGDMDILQVVEGNIFVHTLHKGYREHAVYNSQAVFEKYGIEPKQVPDYKGLAGDSSDNLKWVEGIGPKKAVELLSKYQTLEGIYENIDEIKGAAQQKLIKDRDSAFHCKEMAIIIDEVPVEFDLEHCQTDDLDMDLVERYFQELEFSSLHRRVQKWHSHFINAKNHAASMENLMKQETLF